MRWRPVVVVVTLAWAAGLALAGKPSAPAPKLHLELGAVEATAEAPAELAGRARALFDELISARTDLAPVPAGAPEPRAHPSEYRRFLDDRAIRAFSVALKIDVYQRSLGPGARPGSGQVLTIKLGVTLIGTQLPGGALALAGSGGSTIVAEVGPTLRPREEEDARDDALRDALGHALDDAIAKLRAPPRPARRRR